MAKADTIHALQTGWSRVLVWDTSLLLAASRFEQRWLRRGMRALTRAGDTAGWLVHGAVLGLCLPDGTAMVILLASAAAAGTAASQILKRLCRRARPDHAILAFVPGMPNPDVFSFPSGHSTVAFAVATALASADPVIGALELTLASAIACSRVGLGAHYPLDVVAGTLLGVVTGIGVSASLPLLGL